MSYCLDTNIVIALHRDTPRDVWPTLWDRIEGLITSNRAFVPRQVLIELERIDDQCAPWVREFNGFVVEATDPEIAIVADISHHHPTWVSGQKNEADPWIIAHAEVHRRRIVTDERARGAGVASHNMTIPNVAVPRGVECLDLNGLARAEGWAF